MKIFCDPLLTGLWIANGHINLKLGFYVVRRENIGTTCQIILDLKVTRRRDKKVLSLRKEDTLLMTHSLQYSDERHRRLRDPAMAGIIWKPPSSTLWDRAMCGQSNNIRKGIQKVKDFFVHLCCLSKHIVQFWRALEVCLGRSEEGMLVMALLGMVKVVVSNTWAGLLWLLL